MKAIGSSLSLVVGLFLASCSSTPAPSGALSDYARLGEDAQGVLARRRSHVDAERLGRFHRARLAPVEFADDVQSRTTPEERGFIARNLLRSLCQRVSDRFELAPEAGPEIVTLRVVVSDLRRTSAAAAAASALTLVRVPLGLGALSAEAEALTPEGDQVAALVWRRRADPVFSAARVSRIGDAYDFAAEFGDTFGRLVLGEMGRGGEAARVAGIPTELPRFGGNDQCRDYGGTRLSVDAATWLSPVQAPPSWSERPPHSRPPTHE